MGTDVFEAFHRGNREQVGYAPGIGLELHIVRNLVDAMGGSVTAEANADRGSTLTMSIPDRRQT